MSDKQEEPETPGVLDPNVDAGLTREALYELVWSEPMLKVAARFGVSSIYMARVCTLLYVPRPERGYWAKLAVGKAPKQPALPEPRPGDPLEWSRDGTPPKRARPLPKPPEKKRRKRHKTRTPLPDRHPLTADAKPLFEAGRLSYSAGYLKPAKRLLVDLAVTKTGLDKALSFANQLFLALETRGHRVLIAPNSEQFCRAKVDERENPEKVYTTIIFGHRCAAQSSTSGPWPSASPSSRYPRRWSHDMSTVSTCACVTTYQNGGAATHRIAVGPVNMNFQLAVCACRRSHPTRLPNGSSNGGKPGSATSRPEFPRSYANW